MLHPQETVDADGERPELTGTHGLVSGTTGIPSASSGTVVWISLGRGFESCTAPNHDTARPPRGPRSVAVRSVGHTATGNVRRRSRATNHDPLAGQERGVRIEVRLVELGELKASIYSARPGPTGTCG
jgi:hypothetical protein